MGFLIAGMFPPTLSNWIVTTTAAMLLALCLVELVRLASDSLRAHYSRGARDAASRRRPREYYTDSDVPEPGPGANGAREEYID